MQDQQSSPRTSRAAEKDRAIVAAARDHFLRDGFAGASMDAIAKSAGVSVKTIYSHFTNKDELFSKVMIAVCSDNLLSGKLPPEEVLAERFAWFRDATQQGLAQAGREYLGHLLSEEQIALYRVVTRDADRFPELGKKYHSNFARGRTAILVAYLRGVARRNGWPLGKAAEHAALYEALLRAGIYEEVLHGLSVVNERLIASQAESAAKRIWNLFLHEGG